MLVVLSRPGLDTYQGLMEKWEVSAYNKYIISTTRSTLPNLVLVCLLSSSLVGERISRQAIAQLIGDPRYLRCNVLIREGAKV